MKAKQVTALLATLNLIWKLQDVILRMTEDALTQNASHMDAMYTTQLLHHPRILHAEAKTHPPLLRYM